MEMIEEKIKEVQCVDKLLEIRGIGMKTVIGFVAEVGDIRRFDNPKLVYLKTSILVPDTMSCLSSRLIQQRYDIENSLIFKEKRLDFIRR